MRSHNIQRTPSRRRHSNDEQVDSPYHSATENTQTRKSLRRKHSKRCEKGNSTRFPAAHTLAAPFEWKWEMAFKEEEMEENCKIEKSIKHKIDLF